MGFKEIINPLLQIKFILRQKNTVRVPYEEKKPAERYRGSHFNDINKCIGCGNCSTICMNEAIDMIIVDSSEIDDKEQDSGLRPRVDYGRCCYCGLCVDVCPTGSLQFSSEYIQIEETPDKFTYIPGIERKHLSKSISYTKDMAVSLQNRERVEMPHLDPDIRINSFAEEVLGYSEEEARKEAQRCMECGICVVGCPAHMHIPEYIDDIENNDIAGTIRLMLDNNPLAEICGKVCTRHCEDLCVASSDGTPVAIRWLKRYAAEQIEDYRDILDIKPGESRSGSVGIIGGGPAGITAAYYLSMRGFETVLYEKHDRIGGMTYLGIPRYRLPLESLERQHKLLEESGVTIKLNTEIGSDIDFSTLKDKHDALFMGIGYHKSRELSIEGNDLPGVMQAADFLKRINTGETIEVGKKVIVIGGGNVAIDAARVSKRLGAEVEIYYRRRKVDMPADREEITAAESEHIKIIQQNIPLRFEYGDKDKSFKYYCAPAEMIEEPGKSRPKPVMIEGEVFCIEDIDTVIIAIGQNADAEFISDYDILDERGNMPVDDNGMTRVEGVFAGGDTVNSKNDVISAVADSLKAVRGISSYLEKNAEE